MALGNTHGSWKDSKEVGNMYLISILTFQLEPLFRTSISAYKLRTILSSIKLSKFSLFPTDRFSNYSIILGREVGLPEYESINSVDDSNLETKPKKGTRRSRRKSCTDVKVRFSFFVYES